jgi:chemotaxis response regulator CheB
MVVGAGMSVVVATGAVVDGIAGAAAITDKGSANKAAAAIDTNFIGVSRIISK